MTTRQGIAFAKAHGFHAVRFGAGVAVAIPYTSANGSGIEWQAAFNWRDLRGVLGY